MLEVGQFGEETEGMSSKWNCILCDIIICVCWQDWRDLTEEIAVTMKIVCHDWYYFILLVWVWVFNCVDISSDY